MAAAVRAAPLRSASLDARVRKEARLLVRAARRALAHRRGLRGKAAALTTATEAVERALAAADLGAVRAGLPRLDALVDELVPPGTKSATRDYVESIGAAVLIALGLRAFIVEAFKIPSSSMYPTLEIGDHIFVNKFLYGLRVPFTRTKIFELRPPRRGEVIVFVQPCDPERDYIKRVVATAGQTVEVRCDVLYVDGQAVPAELVDGDGCAYEDYSEEDRRWFKRTCSRYRETVGGHAYDTFHDFERATRPPTPNPDKDFVRRDRPLPPGCAVDGQGGAPLPEVVEREGSAPQRRGTVVETKPAGTPGCTPQLHYVVPPRHVFVMGDNRDNSNDSRFWGSVPIENIKGKAMFIWFSYTHWSPWDWSGVRVGRIGNFVD